MKSSIGEYSAISFVIAIWAVWIAAAIGWVLNVVKVFYGFGEPVTGMFIFRCIGIIAAPVGAILGWV